MLEEAQAFRKPLRNGLRDIIKSVPMYAPGPIGFMLPKDETRFPEKDFQDWYANWSTKTGISPDPDDPKHYYDYRAALS
jgi:hypothetical protein